MNNLTTKNFNKALSNLKLISKHKEVAINDISEINVCYKANLVSIDKNNKVSLLESGKNVLECKSKKLSFIKIIENLVYYNQPDWILEIHKGMENAKINLPNNFVTIFDSLGLFDFNDRDVVVWWNKQKTFKQNYEDQKKALQGLNAEFLVMDYEAKRTAHRPKHMSIHDDSLGYDILSTKSKKDSNSLLIEVKSTVLKKLRFFLTENEYKKFYNNKDSYLIYLIDLSKKEHDLYIINWNNIKSHIPLNKGNGIWKNIEIKPNKKFLDDCKKHNT